MTILVIDAGSSSVRTLLLDERARPIANAIARQTQQFERDATGKAIADPAQLREAIEQCIDEILQHPRSKDIQAVGMATFVGNMLGVDTENQPVTPLITYADTRSAEDVTQLREAMDADAVHQRTGTMLHTAYYPAQLRFLRRTSPESYEQAMTWLDFATYCYRTWFGRAVPTSSSVASWAGLLNRHDLTWDEQLCDAIDLDIARLPELADFDAVQQGLCEAYAGRWKQLAAVPFFLAFGDGAAANIGCGAMDDSHMALTIGTTAAVRVVRDAVPERVPEGLWQYRVSADLNLMGGATGEGGNLYAWATEHLQLPDAEAIEAALQKREPGAHGLTVLPLLTGERSPGWRADAKGAITGIQFATAPIDILQALQESLAHNLAEIAERLKLAGGVVVMGGGAGMEQSGALRQMLANALNRTLCLPDADEVTARGVAVMVLTYLKQKALDDYRPAVRERMQPQDEQVARMRELREAQRELYRKMYGEAG